MTKSIVAVVVLAFALVALALPPAPQDPTCSPCTPALDPNTNVEAVPGLRATVEIVPDYGNCPVTYRGYRWYVSWGDGVESLKNVSFISPEQSLYTYQAPGTYNITIGYCAYPFYCCESCTYKSYILPVKS